jgi:hypothetical protein
MFSARPVARGLSLALAFILTLATCDEVETADEPELRPVRSVLVEGSTAGETVTLSATVES